MNYFNPLSPPAPLSAFSAPYPNLLAALGAVPATPLPAVGLQWIAVRQRFTQFHSNLSLTPTQFLDGMTKRNGVVNCLNRRYYGSTSDTDNSFLVGSWGKDTAMRPPRDVDLYFLLPVAVHTRFQAHVWNRQSALLQEVKAALTAATGGDLLLPCAGVSPSGRYRGKSSDGGWNHRKVRGPVRYCPAAGSARSGAQRIRSAIPAESPRPAK